MACEYGAADVPYLVGVRRDLVGTADLNGRLSPATVSRTNLEK